MTTDIKELKRLAEAATPGPWGLSRDKRTVTSNQSHPVVTVSDPFHRQLHNGETGLDAEFIAAANPATILSLTTNITELEAKLAQTAEPKVPAGYVIVPIEPTLDMVNTGRSRIQNKEYVGDIDMMLAYGAMITAAQSGINPKA